MLKLTFAEADKQMAEIATQILGLYHQIWDYHPRLPERGRWAFHASSQGSRWLAALLSPAEGHRPPVSGARLRPLGARIVARGRGEGGEVGGGPGRRRVGRAREIF